MALISTALRNVRRVSIAIVVLSCGTTHGQSPVYDFSNLTPGNLNGQEGWSKVVAGGLDLNLFVHPSGVVYQPAEGSGASIRINDQQFGFPTAGASDTQWISEFDVRPNWLKDRNSGVEFGFWGDLNGNGTLDYPDEIGFTYGWNHVKEVDFPTLPNTPFFYVRSVAMPGSTGINECTGGTTCLSVYEGNQLEWVRVRVAVDLKANDNAGAVSLYTRNITQGEIGFSSTAISDWAFSELLTVPPTMWQGMFLRIDGENLTMAADNLVPRITLSCDFSGDGMCDVDDAELLYSLGPLSPGVTNNGNELFDLFGDGVIDLADRDEWLSQAAADNGFANPYNVADTNLDGDVNGQDFLTWQRKYGTTLGSIADTDGSGIVDSGDNTIWQDNYGDSINGILTHAIPEPTSASLVFLAIAASSGYAHRRT